MSIYFHKGNENILESKKELGAEQVEIMKIQDAFLKVLDNKNLSFLLGSGCSSYEIEIEEEKLSTENIEEQQSEELEKKDSETELIIAGDTFGFWELTTVQGTAQLDEIVKYHQHIFEQLKRTGERIKITMMVGNHDYDLACYPEFIGKLKDFNSTCGWAPT